MSLKISGLDNTVLCLSNLGHPSENVETSARLKCVWSETLFIDPLFLLLSLFLILLLISCFPLPAPCDFVFYTIVYVSLCAPLFHFSCVTLCAVFLLFSVLCLVLDPVFLELA